MKNETVQDQISISTSGSHSCPPTNLRILLSVHAVLTLTAGVVLIVAPDLIPSAVGVSIEPQAYLISYLLAASELSLAALSWGGKSLSDPKALRLVAMTCIVFHGVSGILEIYAFAKGVSVAILGNIALRAVVVFLFAYFGLYKIPKEATAS